MNLTTAIFLIDASVRAIRVSYEPGDEAKSYVYKTTDATIAKDDMVVVTTDTRHRMTVCKVLEVDVDVDYDSDVKYKWIVGKVDLTSYQGIIDIEAAKMDEVRKAEVLSKREALREKLEKSNPDLFKPTNLLTAQKAEG